MEEPKEAKIERRNGLLKETFTITVLDLSRKFIDNIDNIDLPPTLLELNLSNNKLKCVPVIVLELQDIKVLDLSSNTIKFFDDTPAFCHTIEKLNLAYNELRGPPYWVWANHPKNLQELDISCNPYIKEAITPDYLNELMYYKTSLSIVKIGGCELNTHLELLESFHVAKTIDLSSTIGVCSNIIGQFPCTGLDKCRDVIKLNLSRTWISIIKPNVNMYDSLTEINLSHNSISSLPNEFCKLENLEICILSFNHLLYLPEDMVKLKKLTVLCLDSNKLCMLPESMHEFTNLVKLDLYDNILYDAPEGLGGLLALDLAQNYFEEPVDIKYEEKKKKLRSEVDDRFDGRKFETLGPERSRSESEEEELLYSETDHLNQTSVPDTTGRELSSPEDWDSDDHWVPHFIRPTTPLSPWVFYVKRKMAEGNFCPMDIHPVSVTESVRYEKLWQPKTQYESDGQFDDYSSDDS